MRVPLHYYTHFEVDRHDGHVVLRIRRPFGFTVELVMQDSPLMIDKFLEAFERAAHKTGAIERLRKAMTAKAPAPPPKPRKPGPGKAFSQQGFQRPKSRKKQ